MADPDAQPLTPEGMKRMKRAPQVKVIRRAFSLGQEEFAARFHIPIGTLRGWEQGRKEPDAAAKAYLRVIASALDTVCRPCCRGQSPSAKARISVPRCGGMAAVSPPVL